MYNWIMQTTPNHSQSDYTNNVHFINMQNRSSIIFEAAYNKEPN